MKTYGLPYKGSKDKICEKICSLFPIKENFYDLFMGGGSITHYQLLQNQYKNYYANDFNSLVVKAFDMAIHGKFKNETRWISREEFDKLKNVDPYVAFCFSFGNDLKSYAYGKEIEPYKKALHYLIVFQDESLMKEIFPNVDFSFVHKIKDVNERRLTVQQFMKRNELGYNTPLEGSIKAMSILKHENRLETLNSISSSRLDNIERFEKINNVNLQSLNRLKSWEQLTSIEQFASIERLTSIEQLTIYNKSYDEIEIKDDSVIYCFDKETEILTKNGWKNIGDCTLDDYCLSREPNTSKLEWVKVVNLISYHYNGKMYKYNGKNVDLCVTPNHRMFISKLHTRKHIHNDEFIKAEDLYKMSSTSRFISSGGIWNNKDDCEFVEICGNKFDKLKFARLFGIFLTNGSVNNQGAITISQSKPKICELIENLLTDLNIPYSRHIMRNKCKSYYICRKYLPFFQQFYLKENRHIPKDILNWDVKYLKELLNGILDGDSDSERRKIVIGSKTLTDDIQEICYKCGYSSCYKKVDGKKSWLESENRYINTNKPYYLVSVNNKRYLNVIKNNQKYIDYDDVVNCVTLEKWHTVLVRRNGKCVWCGQCDIPYKSTNKYEISKDFDYEKFYSWCERQTELCFISEYSMPKDRFTCIAEIEHRSIICANENQSVIERVFLPNHQIKDYKIPSLFDMM